MRGAPIRVINLDDVVPDEEKFGSIDYGKYDDGKKVEIKYVSYDAEKSVKNHKDEWKIERYMLPDRLNKDYELPFALVNGSRVSFDEIKDLELRKLYLYCAELGYFLHLHTTWLFAKTGTLPSSINDLLLSHDFLIKENFDNFAKILKSSGAVLKFGIDYDKRIHYFYFAKDNKVYIHSLIEYGTEPNDIRMITYGDEKESAVDMSKSLLTEENISMINIPQQYLISARDIQFSES